MFEDHQPSNDEAEGNDDASSQEEDNEEAKSGDTLEEAEISLNAMAGISKPMCMRLMA